MAANNDYVTVKNIADEILTMFCARHIADRITRRKDFPVPRRIGRVRFWKRQEILAWLEKRKEA